MRSKTRPRQAWIFALALLAAGCIGGQSGTPSDFSDNRDFGCDDGPDATTALGVTGQDLWNLFGGPYTFEVQHGQSNGGENVPEPDTKLTVHVNPSEASLEATKLCDEVVVPVEVVIDSADDSLDQTFIGELHGNPPQGFIHFGTYLTNGSDRFSGSMHFDPELQGFRASEHGRKLDAIWSYQRGFVP